VLAEASRIRLALDLRDRMDAARDLADAVDRLRHLSSDVSLDDGLIDVPIDADCHRAHVQYHWDGLTLVLRSTGLWEMEDLVLDVEPFEH
jgi:hypothetical protein